jgi:hypothetical protein
VGKLSHRGIPGKALVIADQPRSILALRSAGIVLPSVPVIGVRVDESMLEGRVPVLPVVSLSDIEPLLVMLPLFCVAVLFLAAGMVEPDMGACWRALGIESAGIVVVPELAGRCPESEVCALAKLTAPTSAETLATAMRICEVFI